nr:MAG TPA: Portal [Caudoviricetes sp.]
MVLANSGNCSRAFIATSGSMSVSIDAKDITLSLLKWRKSGMFKAWSTCCSVSCLLIQSPPMVHNTLTSSGETSIAHSGGIFQTVIWRAMPMNIFTYLFRSRDKPQNRTSGSGYSFFFGGSTAGKNVNERSAMQMTAVYSCVRILAEAVAGLPLHLYRYKEDGGKEKALDHPLYNLLHDEPNPEMSSFVFRETLMTHLLLWGNAYAQIIRNGKGEVIALYPLMPNRMVVDRDTKGRLYYQYTTSTEDAPTMKGVTVNLPPSDVLHIPGLGFDGLVGYSPIAMAKNAIGMAIACEEYGAKFFANGAAPGGVLEHPGTIKDPQRVRESWQSTFGGSGNSNKIAVLEEGMKYTPIGISPEQAQFLETRKFQVNEIARIFRVPPHMVGDLEKSSFSNIEQQSLEFVKYTLDPWVIRWEQTIHRSLLLPDEKSQYFVKFNLEGLLRGDYQSRMNGYAIGRQNGWMSANDIRELENLDRIPAEEGGDLYLINGNMLPLKDAGAFADTESNDDGKEENADEEVLEVEESSPDGDGSGGTDAVSERHHRRGKLV